MVPRRARMAVSGVPGRRTDQNPTETFPGARLKHLPDNSFHLRHHVYYVIRVGRRAVFVGSDISGVHQASSESKCNGARWLGHGPG
jgi:hypothetical protein